MELGRALAEQVMQEVPPGVDDFAMKSVNLVCWVCGKDEDERSRRRLEDMFGQGKRPKKLKINKKSEGEITVSFLFIFEFFLSYNLSH
jgi:hypothetical protein